MKATGKVYTAYYILYPSHRHIKLIVEIRVKPSSDQITSFHHPPPSAYATDSRTILEYHVLLLSQHFTFVGVRLKKRVRRHYFYTFLLQSRSLPVNQRHDDTIGTIPVTLRWSRKRKSKYGPSESISLHNIILYQIIRPLLN